MKILFILLLLIYEKSCRLQTIAGEDICWLYLLFTGSSGSILAALPFESKRRRARTAEAYADSWRYSGLEETIYAMFLNNVMFNFITIAAAVSQLQGS